MKNKILPVTIAICGYENIWIEYTKILEKKDFNIPLVILNGFNSGEHYHSDDKEYLNLDLLNKGIIPDYYKVQGLGKDYLSQIYHYQFYFDLMFDRFELNANKPKFSSFEKNHIITNLMDYYIHTLKNKQFDFVFFSNIPHNIFDFSFYIACLITNTKTLLVRKEAFNTIHINENFFEENSTKFKKALQKITKDRIVTYQEIESYIKRLQNNNYKKIQPNYMKSQENEKNKGSLLYLLQKGFRKNFLNLYSHFFVKDKTCVVRIKYKQNFLDKNSKCSNLPYIIRISENFFFKKKLVKEYRKNSKFYSKKELKEISYVYLALHYQPEATSLPTGEVFSNQMNIIRLLSASLPKNLKLIVREHPSQLMGPNLGSAGRWLSFYEMAKKFDNVLVANLDTDQIDLINYSQCLATISGTVGVEALAHHKQVMIFGSAWYENLKAVKRISSYHDIKSFLQSLKWPYNSDKELIEELYDILLLNFKNELRDDDSGIRDCYIKAINFYADYIKKKGKK